MPRKFDNIYVEIEGKKIPLKELPKEDYEEFLNGMFKLYMAYNAVVSRTEKP
jgi:hypothetical protein